MNNPTYYIFTKFTQSVTFDYILFFVSVYKQLILRFSNIFYLFYIKYLKQDKKKKIFKYKIIQRIILVDY